MILLVRAARIVCAAVFLALPAQIAVAQTASPSSSPAPSASASPNAQLQAPDRVPGAGSGGTTLAAAAPKPPLVFSGTLRAYDFDRINSPDYQGSNPNREAFNFGGDIRAEYTIPQTHFTIGGAFWGAYPFGANGSPAITQNNTRNGDIDNSLPGFALDTYELYAKYVDKKLDAVVGDQLLNEAWEPSSDSRIKPSLYQAADVTYKIGSFSLLLTRGLRFENRTESLYDEGTLLTTNAAQPTSGFLRYGVTWAPDKRTTVTVEDNEFYSIANLVYASGRYALMPTSRFAPFVAAQFIDEQKSGRAYLGEINNQTTGLQLGFTPAKGVVLTIAGDTAPWRYATFTAASAAAATSAAGKTYFLSTGGTGDYRTAAGSIATVGNNGNGTYTAAYGGIASPYSDSYATDVLYTTSLSQGAVDRRSAGSSFKLAASYTSPNKQFVFLASEALYDYDTIYARNRTSEVNADATFLFNRVRTGPYKGFSIRERLGVRQQPFYAGTEPGHFTYVRQQLQYTF